MFAIRRHRRCAFTLVELLVVLGIIAMLAALLTPAVMWAVNAGRRARMGMEIAQLSEAIEKYKSDKGDYPPSFRDVPALVRHIRRCYPKIAPSEFAALFTPAGALRPECQLDEGEALVFWLAGTRNDPRYPFGLTGGGTSEVKTYYEFDQRRLVQADTNTAFVAPFPTLPGFAGVPSYRAAYAKETFYLYIDSRSYDEMTSTAAFTAGASTGAYGEIDGTVTTIQPEQVVRPYATDTGANMNPTSFQILCAGQDGEWGNVNASGVAATTRKGFPGGFGYFPADRDNMTNFSEGRTLDDHIP